jgi:phosphoglycerol transferase MdoB-like AlkP superfamily enzyme
MWAKYGKSFVAFVWAVVTVIIPLVSGDHHVDTAETVVIVIAFGNNILVYLVPVFPQFKSLKTVVTALLAGVAILQYLVGNGGFSSLDLNDWYQVVAAVGLSLGLWFAPAASTDRPAPTQVTSGFNN